VLSLDQREYFLDMVEASFLNDIEDSASNLMLTAKNSRK
jgi:hypothetical protein